MKTAKQLREEAADKLREADDLRDEANDLEYAAEGMIREAKRMEMADDFGPILRSGYLRDSSLLSTHHRKTLT